MPAEHDEAVAATAVEAEPEETLEPAAPDEDVPELEEGEIDETPMHVELSQSTPPETFTPGWLRGARRSS